MSIGSGGEYRESGFLSGNASRGAKISHEEYVGGKSKTL